MLRPSGSGPRAWPVARNPAAAGTCAFRVLAQPNSKVMDAVQMWPVRAAYFRRLSDRPRDVDRPIPLNVETCRQRFQGRNGYRVIEAALGETSAPEIRFNVMPFRKRAVY